MTTLLLKISLLAFIFTNTFLVILLFCILAFSKKLELNAKLRGNSGVALTALIALYLLFCIILCFLYFFTGNYERTLLYAILFVTPFIIGHLVTYKTNFIYTLIQLLMFLASGCFSFMFL